MKPPIGFVLATYNIPEQTLYLCGRLNTMFDNPPIVIHHDFSQCPLNAALFSSNVQFVEGWRPTKWGSLSVINAQLLALRLLYATSDPDWFVPLSTSDYPIQSADFILRDLYQNDVDIYMDSRPVENLRVGIKNEGLGELSFRHPIWPQIGFNRYVAIPLCTPKTAKVLRARVEKLCVQHPLLTKWLTPFDGSVTCHGGDFWFTANRRIAHLLLDKTPLWRQLHRHYKTRSVPEESFYHTLVANSKGYKRCPDNKRFTDWTGCYAHPRILGREDFPRILKSSDHFARKFPFNPELFCSLDERVEEKDDLRLSSNDLPSAK